MTVAEKADRPTGSVGGAVDVDESRVSWGAIIAGAVCALALQIVFSLFTAGIALELVDDGDASGAGWGSGIFFALTSIASMFAGGSIAGRLSGQPFLPSAVLHGVVVWALVLVGVTWLSVSATGALLSGATQAVSTTVSATGSLVGGAAQGVGSAVSAMTPDMDELQMDDVGSILPPSMEQDLQEIMGEDVSSSEVSREVRSVANEIIDPGEVNRAQAIIASAGRQMLRRPGDAEAILQQAIDRLTQEGGPLGEQQFDELQGILQDRYGISEAEATEIADRWRQEFVEARDQAIETYRQAYNTVATELNDAAEAAAQVAQDAAEAAASASWWTAVGAMLGLAAAAIGAAFGRPEDFIGRTGLPRA